MSFTLFLPIRVLCCGASSCGKSTFITNLIVNRRHIFDEQIEKVLYCASYITSLPEALKNEKIVEFHQGTPTEQVFESYENTDGRLGHTLIVCDDLLESVFQSDTVSKLFSQVSYKSLKIDEKQALNVGFLQGRNRNLSIVILSQVLFSKAKHSRAVNLNCSHLALFRNCRDSSAFNYLARQIAPNNWRNLSAIFSEHCSEAYTYLWFDFQQSTAEILRLRSNVFDEASILFATDEDIQRCKTQGSSEVAFEFPSL